jgi:hypothetical protein
MMRHVVAATLGVLLTPGLSAAQDLHPMIRVALATPRPASAGGSVVASPATAVVGEAVHVTVTVLSPTYFTQPAEWPDTLDMDTAVARIDEGRAQNSTERVGDASYAGISRDYLVYPLTAGTITVPSISIVVTYALSGGVSAPPVTLTSKPISFEARLPPGAESVEQFVSAASLTLTQQFSRRLTGLTVGSAVTRTITMTATDSWSAMFPSIDAAPIDGVSIYPKAPVLRDTTADRGARSAERIESTSYVFERPGSFTLPAVSVAWWDNGTRRLRSVKLPAMPVTVVASTASSSQIAFRDEEGEAQAAAALARATRRERERMAVFVAAAVAALVVIVWLARQFGPRTVHAVVRGWRRMLDSEPVYFVRAWRAGRAGKADQAYAATLAWIDRAWSGPLGAATLEQLAVITSNSSLAREVAALEAWLFGRPDRGQPAWSGRRFSSVLWRARSSLLELSRERGRSSVSRLPLLNPNDHDDRAHPQLADRSL